MRLCAQISENCRVFKVIVGLKRITQSLDGRITRYFLFFSLCQMCDNSSNTCPLQHMTQTRIQELWCLYAQNYAGQKPCFKEFLHHILLANGHHKRYHTLKSNYQLSLNIEEDECSIYFLLDTDISILQSYLSEVQIFWYCIIFLFFIALCFFDCGSE